VQYGRGDKAMKNPNTGESVAGPVTLSDEELAKNRVDAFEELKKHPFDDAWHRSRSADLTLVRTPLLTCANWGGQGIHPRGNFNGYTETPADTPKWLEVHGDSHWSMFSSGYGVALQKRFFDHYLKGESNGWDKEPRVQLNIRHPGEKFVLRPENEWPLARTQWTKLFLDPANMALTPALPAQQSKLEYDALGDGLTFTTPPMEKDTEITGPMAAKLFISSTTSDADLFVIVRVFDPAGRELTFMGSTDPNTPIANGWLRASHRRLDPQKSHPWRPYHPHDRAEPLTPGEIYECDVEIVTSCIVVPAGWRVAFTIRGKDYEYAGELADFAKKFHYGTRGTGGMTHNDPDSRPPSVFGGRVTLHAGGGRESYLLLPIIPPAGA
jgi:predicted acyl esterase